MDTLQNISYTHRFWVFLLPLVLMAADVVTGWIQPNSTNPYMKGDKVTHNGKTWVSDVDNNVWEPSVYGWSEVTEGGNK